jgi:hypothetical protein
MRPVVSDPTYCGIPVKVDPTVPGGFVYLTDQLPRRNMRAVGIAHVCHEANRALQIEQADPTIPVSPTWALVDHETRQSAIQGVRGILAGNTPEQSHQGWMSFKRDHGWKLGPVKDELKKEHPLLVPYADLPPAQQAKDRLFHAIVTALA